jgi:hypothetical protein
MTFVQIIEMTTTKASEIEELMNGWLAATEGRRSASRSLLTKDRERVVPTAPSRPGLRAIRRYCARSPVPLDHSG